MDRVRDVRPHATVEVLSGVHRPLPALGGLPLGHPGGIGGVSARVEAPCRVLPRDTHRLDVDGGIGRPQHGALERAEGPAELLAAVEIGRCHRQRRLAHTHLQRAQRGGGRHLQHVEGGAPAVRTDQDVVLPHRHSGEVEVGVDLAVCGGGALERDARRGGIQQDQQHPAVVGAGRQDDAVRQVGLGHRQLGPLQNEAVARSACLHRRHGRRAVGASTECGREDDVAGDDAGQPGGALGLGAEAGQRQRTEHERGPQGHGGHGVPLRFEQQAELHQAVAGAAVGLGDGQPEEVGLGQGLPQITIDAVGAAFDVGDLLRVDQTREQPAGRLGDRRLLIGQLEVHQASFPAGTNTGNESSSSKSTNSAWRRMPISIASWSMPSRLATSRVPSSSSMSPIGSGYSNDGTCG